MVSPVLPEAELQVLVRKAQEGDTEAFARIYDFFFPQVYRYAAFRASADIAEDIVSDVFVKVWEKLHTYQERKGIPFGAWLFRIARYEVIDTYRRSQDIVEVPEELHDPDDLNRAETKMNHKDLLRVVRAAMDQLPRRYRDILLLSFMADLSHGEIAQTLKMSEGAVRILKFRALKKLELLLPPEVGKKA